MNSRTLALLFLFLASSSTHAALQFGCNFTVRATALAAAENTTESGEEFYLQIPWSGYSPTGGEGCNQQVQYSHTTQVPGAIATANVTTQSSLTRQGELWIFESTATTSTVASTTNIMSYPTATADVSTTINIIATGPFRYSLTLTAQGLSMGDRRAFAAARFGWDEAVFAGDNTLIALPNYGDQFDYQGPSFEYSAEVTQAPFLPVNLGGDAFSRPIGLVNGNHAATFTYRVEFAEISSIPLPPSAWLMGCGLIILGLYRRSIFINSTAE